MHYIYGLEKSQKTQLGLVKLGVRISNESWTGSVSNDIEVAGVPLAIPTWLDIMIVPVSILELINK